MHMLYKHSDSIKDNLSVPSQQKSFNQDNSGAKDRSSFDQNVQEPEELKKQNQEKKENRCGRATRKSYTVEFKKQTLDLLDSLSNVKHKWKKVADAKNVSKSLVVKWNKSRQSIFKSAESTTSSQANVHSGKTARSRRHIYNRKKVRPQKYPLAEKRLLVEFKLRREKGSKISKVWFKTSMKKKIESCYGAEEARKFKASNTWFQRFKKRNNISLRRRTNKKKNAANDGRQTIQQFHRELRKAVQSKRRRSNAVVDKTYGRWLPQNRLNVDQVPLPFVVEQDKTYEFTGNKQVWVSQPGSGLDKRQATLQLCIKAEGQQTVKPAIIFRGKGNVASKEQQSYDKDVDVYFQANAWMDTDVNKKWTEQTLKNGLGDDPTEKLLFADNVGFQAAQEFHVACRKMNTIVYLLPDNHTDKVQPIDAGFGKMMKLKIGESMESWLEKDENLEMWHDKLTAKKRRILMTQWVGNAWRELASKSAFIKKLFIKTGCLMTTDGSDDEKINPQGLDAYSF